MGKRLFGKNGTQRMIIEKKRENDNWENVSW